jgi:hypothetical protein
MVDVRLEPFLRNVQIRNIAKDRRLGIYIRHLVARAQLEGMGTADSLSDGPRILWNEEINAADSGSSRNEQNVPRGKHPLDTIKTTLRGITLVLSLVSLENLAVTRQHRELVCLATS